MAQLDLQRPEGAQAETQPTTTPDSPSPARLDGLDAGGYDAQRDRLRPSGDGAPDQIADKGVKGADADFPHKDKVEAAFGKYSLGDAKAKVGGDATEANTKLGAKHFVKDGEAAFGQQPTPEEAGHEGAHLVLQKLGVGPDGGQSKPGDPLEQNAEAVGKAVAGGQNAEPLLDAVAGDRSGGDAGGVQKMADPALQFDGDENDYDVKRGREYAADIRAGKYAPASSVLYLMETLSDKKSPAASAALGELRAACLTTDFLFKKHDDIKKAVAFIDAHKKGTDNHPLSDSMGIYSLSFDLEKGMKHAGDPRFSGLYSQIMALYQFYSAAYGQDIKKYRSEIRQIHAFLDAGQVHDWGQHVMDLMFWVPDLMRKVLVPNLDNPLFNKSNAFKQYESLYNEFNALNTRLSQLGDGNIYASSGRARTKAQLMTAPDTIPEYKPMDAEQTEKDVQDTIKAAEELLKPKSDALPGDYHTMILRLQMMRSHVKYQYSDGGRIDRLITDLKAAFEKSEDPEYARQKSDDDITVEADLSSVVTVTSLAGTLNKIANEPGEKGTLGFKISGKASIGTGLIGGYVKGWAELKLFYTVTDTMTCVLGFDVAAAIGAGISLAGLVEAGVEVGAGYGMKARFNNPNEVASWLCEQMEAVNKAAGVSVFNVHGKYGDIDPVVLSEKKKFGKVEANADLGVLGASGEAGGASTSTTFSQEGQNIATTAKTKETTLAASAFVKLGKYLTVTGSYGFTSSTVEGDMNTANNGEYHNHQLGVNFDLSGVIKEWKGGVVEQVPKNTVQDAVLKIFAQLESKIPGGVPKQILHASFDSAVEKLYETIQLGKKLNVGAECAIGLEWNNVKENGAYRNQYFRLSVTPKLKASLGVQKTAGFQFTAEVSASKSEVLYEDIGSETYSYVLQRYMFAWDRAQWDAFVKDQRDDLEKLIHNIARSGSKVYDAEAARYLKAAGYPGGSFESWLKGLEKFFESKRATIIDRKRGGRAGGES